MFNTRVPLYGIFIIISIFSGIFLIYKNSKILNLTKEETIGLLIYITLGAIFGAKYYTFFTNIGKFNGNFDFYKIGLSSYGAVIGIIILLFIYAKQFKKRLIDLIYILLPSLPLMYGVGKIGCFLTGCCFGINYSGPFSVLYKYSFDAPKGIQLFPIQLLEAIVFIIIFIYIFRKIKIEKNNKRKNEIIGLTFIICGLAKFILDYLRMSHLGKILSVNQIVSIIFLIIGLFFIIDYKNKSRNS